MTAIIHQKQNICKSSEDKWNEKTCIRPFIPLTYEQDPQKSVICNYFVSLWLIREFVVVFATLSSFCISFSDIFQVKPRGTRKACSIIDPCLWSLNMLCNKHQSHCFLTKFKQTISNDKETPSPPPPAHQHLAVWILWWWQVTQVTRAYTVYTQKADVLECNSCHEKNQYAKYIPTSQSLKSTFGMF